VLKLGNDIVLLPFFYYICRVNKPCCDGGVSKYLPELVLVVRNTPVSVWAFFMQLNFQTRTRIDKDYIVIEVHADGAYWHDYFFPIELKGELLTHIEDKVWCTVKNYKEIQLALYEGRNNSI
jgi:hypothetical protein